MSDDDPKNFQLYFYFVFTTKYRKDFMTAPVAEDVRESMESTAQEHEIRILALTIKDDHVHLVASLRSSMSVADAAQKLKGRASREVRQKHPHLQEYKAFWGKKYFVRTVGPKDLERAIEFVNSR